MSSQNNNGNDGHNNGNDDQRPFTNKLYVRFMVSLRCKIIVKDELNNLGINYLISVQGAIEFPEGISSTQQIQLKKNLQKSGLELLEENESMLIDKIINTIIDIIHNSDSLPKISYKEIIHENLVIGNESILKIFIEVKGVSITQYIIYQKIERAKVLILYHDLTLAEIADKLNYRNENYFVSQFKKLTGLSPSYFTEIKNKRAKKISQN